MNLLKFFPKFFPYLFFHDHNEPIRFSFKISQMCYKLELLCFHLCLKTKRINSLRLNSSFSHSHIPPHSINTHALKYTHQHMRTHTHKQTKARNKIKLLYFSQLIFTHCSRCLFIFSFVYLEN